MVAGEVVYQGARFTRVDRDTALRELHASLQHALGDDEIERRQLSKALLPMSGISTPAISTPRGTCPTTVRARWCEALAIRSENDAHRSSKRRQSRPLDRVVQTGALPKVGLFHNVRAHLGRPTIVKCAAQALRAAASECDETAARQVLAQKSADIRPHRCRSG
jgi:hypothetical protein